MTILDTIADYTRKRVAAEKVQVSPGAILAEALSAGPGNGNAFYEAVGREGIGLICEVKKASPSKGLIDPVFDYLGIARAYEAAGADAISCLTEPNWFLGSDDIFRDIRRSVGTPMLRKDFVVDEYQICQARLMGADCVLLICALLDEDTLRRYLALCETLGLAALTEAHNEAEIRSAVRAGARMIGVNNRNLKDFSVDLGNAARLRDRIPGDILFVAESGIKTPEDVSVLREAGADAVLVGEMLMRAADKKALLLQIRETAG